MKTALTSYTRRWWRAVNDAYELEDHHRRLLTLAAQAWDRTEEAREALAEHGTVYIAHWSRQRPGERPDSWWLCEAPEPRRRRLGGIGDPSIFPSPPRNGLPTSWVDGQEAAALHPTPHGPGAHGQ